MVVACTLAHGHLSRECEAEVAGDGTEKESGVFCSVAGAWYKDGEERGD